MGTFVDPRQVNVPGMHGEALAPQGVAAHVFDAHEGDPRSATSA